MFQVSIKMIQLNMDSFSDFFLLLQDITRFIGLITLPTTCEHCDSFFQSKNQALSSIDKSSLKRCTWKEIPLKVDCFFKYMKSILVRLFFLPCFPLHSASFSLTPSALSIYEHVLLCLNYKPNQAKIQRFSKINMSYILFGASLVAQMVKNPPAM